MYQRFRLDNVAHQTSRYARMRIHTRTHTDTSVMSSAMSLHTYTPR